MGVFGGGVCPPSSMAQVLPHTVEPEQFEKRFEPPPLPRARPRLRRSLPFRPRKPAKKPLPGFILKKVKVEGATRYSPKELRPLYRSYLKRRVTFPQLQDIGDALTAKYRNDGYILSRRLR